MSLDCTYCCRRLCRCLHRLSRSGRCDNAFHRKRVLWRSHYLHSLKWHFVPVQLHRSTPQQLIRNCRFGSVTEPVSACLSKENRVCRASWTQCSWPFNFAFQFLVQLNIFACLQLVRVCNLKCASPLVGFRGRMCKCDSIAEVSHSVGVGSFELSCFSRTKWEWFSLYSVVRMFKE